MTLDTQPLVSIIIPTYNRADLLHAAVYSALGQTYSNLEVIIVDDCSLDHTEKTVATFDDPRIQYTRNEHNSGPCVTRNRGLTLAQGEYINFLDDDDELLPTKIEKQVQKFRSVNEKTGVVTCDVEYRRDDIDATKQNRKQGNIYKDLLTSYCVYATHSMLIKKETLASVQYDNSLPSGQEYDLMLQIAKQGREFDYLAETLCRVHQSRDQISFNFKKKIKGNLVLIRKRWKQWWIQGPKVGIYNCLRFGYLLVKFSIGYVLGKKIYLLLPY